MLTVLALVLIPKEYTSSMLLGVWHADIQSDLIGAESQNGPRSLTWNRVWRRSVEETIARRHLEELISKHGLYVRDGKPRAGCRWTNGRLRSSIDIPDSVLQSKTPTRWQKMLPPDAVEISFQYRDPAKAQAVANDLGNVMIDAYRKELERHNAETIKLVSSELNDTKSQLAETQRQIKVLKEKYRGSLPQDLNDNVKAVEALQLQVGRTAQNESIVRSADAASSGSAKSQHTRCGVGGSEDKTGRAQGPVQR